MGNWEVIHFQERLEDQARYGLFYLYAKIGKKKAEKLRDSGFLVTDSKESDKYPRLHRISWESALVPSADIYSLNENDKFYTLPQKLWIISMKNRSVS